MNKRESNLERLDKIFAKTDGHCHLCSRKLVRSKYGKSGTGAWHIEHSNPRANGGTDHLNNLFPAHATCNREKGVLHTRVVRKKYGNTRAPLSAKRKQQIRQDNAILYGGLGTVAGAFGGPLTALLLGGLGVWFGNEQCPKK